MMTTDYVMNIPVYDIVNVINFICLLLSIVSISDGIVLIINNLIHLKKYKEENRNIRSMFMKIILAIFFGIFGFTSAKPIGLLAIISLIFAMKEIKPKHIWIYIVLPIVASIGTFILALYLTFDIFFNNIGSIV